MPYPFNYFSSLFQVRKAFANRKQLNWFQMIFTSLFLLSLTLIPVAVQNAELQTYPLTTFVSDVFLPWPSCELQTYPLTTFVSDVLIP